MKPTAQQIAAAAPAAYPFQVWYSVIYEEDHSRNVPCVFAKAFATWDAAMDYANEIEGSDGVQIVGSTPEAAKEIADDFAKAEAEYEAMWEERERGVDQILDHRDQYGF